MYRASLKETEWKTAGNAANNVANEYRSAERSIQISRPESSNDGINESDQFLAKYVTLFALLFLRGARAAHKSITRCPSVGDCTGITTIGIEDDPVSARRTCEVSEMLHDAASRKELGIPPV